MRASSLSESGATTRSGSPSRTHLPRSTWWLRPIWSEYATGDGHLPAVLYLSDKARQRQCFLTLDLYEPGVPVTAKERFSLKDEQNEFNNIYFECLKAKRVGGLNRIGFMGNVAAWLGPRLERDHPLASHFRNFRSITGNETEAKNVRFIDMASFESN
ncbi:MAG: hypothetical protein Q9182_002513 [Xanthomendoza sp. 2 TL-2023]